jgi:hypothetical protein
MLLYQNQIERLIAKGNLFDIYFENVKNRYTVIVFNNNNLFFRGKTPSRFSFSVLNGKTLSSSKLSFDLFSLKEPSESSKSSIIKQTTTTTTTNEVTSSSENNRKSIGGKIIKYLNRSKVAKEILSE